MTFDSLDREWHYIPERDWHITDREFVCNGPGYHCEVHYVRLADDREMAFVHLDVDNMAPSTLRAMKRGFEEHRPGLPRLLFALFDEDSPSRHHLATFFGFQRLDDMVEDGKTRRLYVSVHK